MFVSTNVGLFTINEGKKKNVFQWHTQNILFMVIYMVRHMVKDHSDSERGNQLLPHGLLFLISSKFFLMPLPTDRIAHTTVFVTPVMEHWLEWEIAQWVLHDDSSHHGLPWSYMKEGWIDKRMDGWIDELINRQMDE